MSEGFEPWLLLIGIDVLPLVAHKWGRAVDAQEGGFETSEF